MYINGITFLFTYSVGQCGIKRFIAEVSGLGEFDWSGAGRLWGSNRNWVQSCQWTHKKKKSLKCKSKGNIGLVLCCQQCDSIICQSLGGWHVLISCGNGWRNEVLVYQLQESRRSRSHRYTNKDTHPHTKEEWETTRKQWNTGIDFEIHLYTLA